MDKIYPFFEEFSFILIIGEKPSAPSLPLAPTTVPKVRSSPSVNFITSFPSIISTEEIPRPSLPSEPC
jgi:hypothetical protein